jgi:AbiV family abortive infection protein
MPSESVREHYIKGKDFAQKNSIHLMSSAELMVGQGNYGLAQSLALLAYEEASKSVYCSIVALGLASENDIKDVFSKHEPKIILFDKMFKEKISVVDKNVIFKVSGEDIARAILNAGKDSPNIKEHSNRKNAGLYVGHYDHNWTSPNDMTKEDTLKLIKECKERITILYVMAQIFLDKYEDVKRMDNFTATTFMKTDGSMGAIVSFTSEDRQDKD